MPDVSYVPGALIAVAGDRCLAVVEAAPDSAATTWIWQQVTAGASAEALLAGLLGGGFEGVGGLALLAGLPARQRRLFCRGAVAATVEGGNVSARIDGAGLLTWREYAVATDAERIVLGEPPDDNVLRLPTAAGVLLASCVIIDLTSAASRDTLRYDSPVAGYSAGAYASGRPEVATAPWGLPRGRRVAAFAEVADLPEVAALPEVALVPEVAALPEVALVPEAAALPEVAVVPQVALLPDDDSGAGSGESIIGDSGAQPAVTLHPDAVATARVIAPPETADTGRTGVPASLAPPAPVRPRSPEGLIDAVEWGPGPGAAAGRSADRTQAPSAGAPLSAAEHGEDEFTVKRAELPAPGEAEQAARAAAPPGWIGPLVPVLMCPAGHMNPPSEANCRRCGSALPNDAVVAPRPALGVLRLSTGDVVTLDRGVVMGRNPRTDFVGAESEERPHVVSLPSAGGDISRTHLRVTIDGWHVLVTDLNSTNGTLVALPGRDPEQLRPGEPVPIKPGTVVTLADGIDFRYEVAE
jgi:hypothetical protein